jgi:hypothetical protein
LDGDQSSSGVWGLSELRDKRATLAIQLVQKIGQTKVTESIPANDKRPVNVGSIDLPVTVLAPSHGQSARIVVRNATGRIGTAELSGSQSLQRTR